MRPDISSPPARWSRQLRAAGVTAPIIGSQAFDSEKFIEIAGPAAEGVTIIDSFNRQPHDAALKNFFDGFKKQAGYRPREVSPPSPIPPSG